MCSPSSDLVSQSTEGWGFLEHPEWSGISSRCKNDENPLIMQSLRRRKRRLQSKQSDHSISTCCYMIPNRCLLFWFGEGSISADKNWKELYSNFHCFQKAFMHTKKQNKHFQLLENKPKKHGKSVDSFTWHLAFFIVFCFPSYLEWCQHQTWKPHHGNILQLLHAITQGPPLTSLVSKAIRRTRDLGTEGQREMLSNSPTPTKSIQIKGQPLQQWATSLKLNRLNIWSNRHSFPASDSCSNHKKLDSKDGWNDSKTSPPSGFFLRIQKAQPQKMQVFFLQWLNGIRVPPVSC